MKKSPKVYTLVLKNITFNDISSPENNNTINRIPATLQEFLDVFNKEGTTTFIPYRPGVDLNIEFQEGKQPLYGPFYPLSSTELEVLQQYLEENLKKRFIQPSKSLTAAPILFVPKKNNILRLYIDYKSLNSITIKNRHFLPLINEIINKI